MNVVSQLIITDLRFYKYNFRRFALQRWLKEKLEISHGDNRSLLSMEGLRGVAVFLVFLVHYSALIEPWVSGYTEHILIFISGFGHLGVDLFFVLSGYLIYGSILNKKYFSVAAYGGRRLHRIYPTFLVVFSAYIVLSFIFPSESKLPQGMIEKVLYITQNLFLLPGLFDIEPLITVAWSLSYEVFYYLFIPIVIFSFKLQCWRVDNRVIFWVLVSATGMLIYLYFDGPVRLLMFIAGILLFELYSEKQFTLNKGGTRFLLMALMIFGLRSIFEFNYAFSISCIFVLFLLLCLCAFNSQSRAYRWLTYTPVRWLGNMSYSYYLIHGLTLKFCFLIFSIVMPVDFNSSTLYYWLWIPFFGLTLVVSFMLFVLVERPLSLNVSSTIKVTNSTFT